MKKNLIPLLGIAFVVALLATGVFYSLFVNRLGPGSSGANQSGPVVIAAHRLDAGSVLTRDDLREISSTGPPPAGSFVAADQLIGRTVVATVGDGEPVVAAKVTPRVDGDAAVPAGMRAVSIRAYDSLGLLQGLRAGQRVDLQAYRDRRSPGAEDLRTILQDVPVLSSVPPEAGSHGALPAIVTVLLKPDQADVVALADSYGRLRLALRNSKDRDITDRGSYELAALFKGTARMQAAAAGVAKASPKTGEPGRQTMLEVRFLGVSQGALSRYSAAGAKGFHAVAAGSDIEKAIRDMEGDRVKTFQTSRVSAAYGRPAIVESTATWDGDMKGGLTIRFSPVSSSRGTTRLHIGAAVTAPSPGGVNARRLETDVDLAQGVLLAGLLESGEREAFLRRLWKEPPAAGRDLWVMVTPKPGN